MPVLRLLPRSRLQATQALASSKVRNDARVDGKGAGRGSTYPYDHPKHALATTLPLHDPLDLVSSTSARVFWEGVASLIWGISAGKLCIRLTGTSGSWAQRQPPTGSCHRC